MSKRSPFAWALFLGTSWTWCIGMFLPVLLVRDLGAGAFLVFAVPNVLGAAGMGFVLGREDLSGLWVARHRGMCRAFSVVTILFHLFFAGWVIQLLVGWSGGLVVIGLAGMLYAVGRVRTGRDISAAMGVYLFSLVCVGLWLVEGKAALPGNAHVLLGANTKLLCLAPVCLFGFMLCPYLDLTFHRARQGTTETGAKIAFGVGFGIFFFFMIFFTLLYSGAVVHLLDGEMLGRVGWIIGAHMAVQSGFTIAAHLRELWSGEVGGGRVMTFLLAGVGMILGVGWVLGGEPGRGEIPYLLFLSFYGLVFPAYVWFVLLGGVRWRVLGGAIVGAMPFYYVGFIQREMIWLLPGVAIPVLAGVFFRGVKKPE